MERPRKPALEINRPIAFIEGNPLPGTFPVLGSPTLLPFRKDDQIVHHRILIAVAMCYFSTDEYMKTTRLSALAGWPPLL